MEDNDCSSSARRRLILISRHLLNQEKFAESLQARLVRAEESEVSEPVIVGGMVMDIHAKPFTNALPGTTTPGKVQYISGGVARNVAECMSKLGRRPFMISVIGHDMAGDQMLRYWNNVGLPTEGILRHEGISTPVVSNIFDCDGELAAAVASVDAVEKLLTPDWVLQFKIKISSAPVLFIDANLHPKSLEASCEMAADFGIPVWFEPVSVTKSARIGSIAGHITFASPNEHELIAMANVLSENQKFNIIDSNRSRQSVESLYHMLRPAISVLLEKGVKVLIVTIGSDGVLLCSKESPDIIKNRMNSGSVAELYELVKASCPSMQIDSLINSSFDCICPYAIHFPAVSASVVNVSGAGDCLVGGMLASISSGLDVIQSAAVGVAVAKVAVESQFNVPTECNMTSIAGSFAASTLVNIHINEYLPLEVTRSC